MLVNTPQKKKTMLNEPQVIELGLKYVPTPSIEFESDEEALLTLELHLDTLLDTDDLLD